MEKNLDEQFPYPKQAPKESYRGKNEHLLLYSLRMVNILRYIIEHNCVLEIVDNVNKGNWTVTTLREFLRFSTGKNYQEKPNATGFQDYLRFFRIKTKPTEQEIYDACHVK